MKPLPQEPPALVRCTAALATIVKTWKQTVFSNTRMGKESGMLLTCEERTPATAATGIKLGGTVLSEMSQTRKGKYFMMSLTCEIKQRKKLAGMESKSVYHR